MPVIDENDPRNLLGKTINVPAGLHAICKSCKTSLITDGTEKAIAHRDHYWVSDRKSSMDYLAVTLTCPCGYGVEFVTDKWVGP